MATRALKIGIISREVYQKRTMSIAKGEYIPRKGEPKVWFESIESISQILSSKNQELLRLILEKKPKSLTELENISGRKKANLSRTLKTLQRYGIVDLERVNNRLIPKVKATDFKVEFGLHL